jgi:acetyl esterase/lipase
MFALLALVPMLQVQPEEVVYSHVAGLELHLDVYRPAPSPKPTPAMVLIHGGGWIAGDWRGMGWLADLFVPRGVFCASVEYRFRNKFKWPAQLEDVQTAVRYLRAHAKDYNIDPKRIGAAGDSAGGHLSQCLGVYDTHDPHPTEYPGFPSKVEAVWNNYGPTDFTYTMSDDVRNMGKDLAGGDTAARLREISPYWFASRKSAPTFFIQGKSDPVVAWQQAQHMSDRLRALHVETSLNLIDGMGHGLDMGNPKQAEAAHRAVDWVLAHL